jgi:drug/metabolite transporter (DMT)-like permease
MPFSSAISSVVFGLTAAITWGIGDFSGGFATRRARVLPVVLLSQLVGIILLISMALLLRERLPSPVDLAWGATSGVAGLVGLASLYRAMAMGQMGIVAPVSGVISAALPVIASALTESPPPPMTILGFGLALVGVWLISRTNINTGNHTTRPTGIGFAILSGIGFGSFLILIAQTQHGSVFWPLAAARGASLSVLIVASLAQRSTPLLPRQALIPAALAGVMDSGGNLFFVLASQAGRLDVAGVLSSLYPATTVLLALILLHERLARSQLTGVAFALAAIALISAP